MRYLILILALTTCSSKVDLWSDGLIVESGEYEFAEGKVHVSDNSGLLEYKILDVNGGSLLQQDVNASTLQKWSLVMTEDRVFWLISTDIGIYSWKYDKSMNKYNSVEIDSQILIESVSENVKFILKNKFPYYFE